MDYKNQKDMSSEWNDHILDINCKIISPLQFEATQEEKAALIDSGRESAEEFLRQGSRRRPLPARRFSFS
jgi:hypothetical protein